ncbi:flagellar protein FlaG [Thermomicrobiaceae bacterium CFH 74404]|uniref:Flagellar protein FlaG n=2 Tax=Thermomicrobia TaxID=189775 RepID=A0AA41WGK7_9BACT|nr:flagellar protein FlaG [Thermalbibacter longus]MCM8749728.1 flagellar protein FlaG [Thermalbibacter longus]
MADPITPVAAVGSVDSLRDQTAQVDHSRQAGRVAPQLQREPSRRASDIPAHTVDLSLDPQAVRRLPADIYVRYYVHPGIGNYVVQIIDRRTDEVIREIPPGGLEMVLQELARQRQQSA